MFDRQLRAVLDRPFAALARRHRKIRAQHVTAAGFVAGVGACISIALDWRFLALAGWLANRLCDGLDGAVARRDGASDRGGFVDIVADFAVYAGFIVGVAVARPDSRMAAVVLLSAYYVSGVAFLALSSLFERRRVAKADNRSLHFVGGIAEGAETVAVYGALCLWPSGTNPILWVFAVAVSLTALQRVVFGWRVLSGHDQPAHEAREAGGAPGA